MAIYICNSFSLAMLEAWRLSDTESKTTLSLIPISDPFAWLADAESRHGAAVSAVGHADTAALFSALLGREIPMNRISVVFDEATEILVGQLTGPRPPEGSTTLPEGAKISWVAMTIS